MSTSSGPQALHRGLYSLAGQPALPLPAAGSALSQPTGRGTWREIPLNGDAPTVTIGRSNAADITVPADATVSRLHAIIERVSGCWIIIDDGLSKNGTFVNGERVGGRRKLSSGDRIRVGRSLLVFRDGASSEEEMTIALSPLLIRNSLTDAQIMVLKALCRPYDARSAYSYPHRTARSQAICA